MDKVQFKIRLRPELVKKLKELHPSYGELSRVVGEMLELYVVSKTTKERRPTMDNATMYEEKAEDY